MAAKDEKSTNDGVSLLSFCLGDFGVGILQGIVKVRFRTFSGGCRYTMPRQGLLR